MTTIREALATAIQHHQAGRLQDAEQIYRRILAAEPNQPDALHLLGVIACQTGKHEMAVDYITRAIQQKGDAPFCHNNLGESYRALKRYTEAVACYRRALELKPDYAEACNNLGVTLKEQGELDEAMACYRRALTLKPDYAEAHGNLGNALKEQGKLDEALASYRRAVESKPAYAEAHYNLANALREQGRLVEAVGCYRRAIELNSNYAEAHNNLGNALKDLGKPDEALACYRQALHLRAEYAEAHVNIGVVFMASGRLDEALDCYRRALQLKPGFPQAHFNLGNGLLQRGRLDEAVGCYRRAIELKPDYAEAHTNLGNALKEQGKLDSAVACYRRVLELQPNSAEAYSNLGNAMKEEANLEEAVACCRRAIELKPGLAEAHASLGAALKDEGKLDEALACCRRALELRPDLADAHGCLGSVLVDRGDLKGAEDCFRAALRIDPRFAFAHYKLAELLGRELSANDMAAQPRLLDEGELADAQRLLLHFGLARALDAQGEYAEAARHLDRANSLELAKWRNRGREYDPQEHESRVSRMILACTPGFFERVRGFGLDSELPVFVVGLPRSGTTLIEQILAGHSQVFAGGELKLADATTAAICGQDSDTLEGLRRLDRETAGRLASVHLDRLHALGGTALRVIDKMPDNYLLLGPLASLFPKAKFIHCRRDLRDVAVSCWMTHFQNIRWANDPRHIASRFHEYRRIMAHWRKVLPVPVLEINYEDAVADLETTARLLVAWCGLEWEPGCLAFHAAKRPVRTVSAVQVRQPIFRTSVGRWKHYEHALGPMFAALPSG